MKVVINTCFGGFSLSARAVKRWAALKGRKCYFYRNVRDGAGKTNFDRIEPITTEEAESEFMWFAYDIPNAHEVKVAHGDFYAKPLEERRAENKFWEEHSLDHGRDLPRHDPDLIRVVEELGGGRSTGASGMCAELTIVEIPDGVDYEIEEYDGNEHVAERHRTWR